jgi:hypothetical protein
MADAIAAVVVATLLRFGGGSGLHRRREEVICGAGFQFPGLTYKLLCLTILSLFAADGLLDIPFADRRSSASSFTPYLSMRLPTPGDCRQAHLADHIYDRTSGEIVLSGDAFQVCRYLCAW